MCGRLDFFLDTFASLEVACSGEKSGEKITDLSRQAALLLLALLDCIETGRLVRNFISPSEDLERLFRGYCTLILPPDRQGGMATSFCHLAGAPFWELKPQPGKSFDRTPEAKTLPELRSHYFGAKFSDDLYPLLQMATFRRQLRQVLIESYFDGDERQRINARSAVASA